LDDADGQDEEKDTRKSISDELPRKPPKVVEEPKKVATVAPIEPKESGKRSARISSTETRKAPEKSPLVCLTQLKQTYFIYDFS
jgi:hypothetical protein